MEYDRDDYDVDECSDSSGEQDDFSCDQSGVSGVLEVADVGDGRDDVAECGNHLASVPDILKVIKRGFGCFPCWFA